MFLKLKIHLVGIGGIGMSAIAQILFQKGFKITGSDLSQNLITKKLQKQGIKIFNSHNRSNVKDVDIVVFSSAINKNNPEIKEAKKRKIPVFSRAMMLAEVMRLKPSITVAGSHGKTTTTSLIACILEMAGLDPTVINGGIINSINANAKLGKGEFIIAEADESDGSFTFLPSTVGVINNIDLEHLDYYKDLEEIKDSFIKYANNIPFYGFLSICNDDKNTKSILKKIKTKSIVTFGLTQSSNYRAKNIKISDSSKTTFDVWVSHKKKLIKNVTIPMIGNHNILNSLGAMSICYQLNIPSKKILAGLRSFAGVKRRFSVLYKNKKNLVIDDYAHHPNEIKTTLNSLKIITKNKVVSVFEPHRYSRLENLLEEFLLSFLKSDYIYILPIYSAGEKNTFNLNNEKLVRIFRKKYGKKTIKKIDNEKMFFLELKELFNQNNNIIFLGAGRSSTIANNFSKYLKSNE